jgi:peptide/nickel transport system ATP-binding protein
MYAGQIAELGPTGHIFERPLHPYTRGLLGAFPSIHGTKVPLTGIPGQPPDLARPPAGCRFAPRCPSATAVCRAAEPRLLDVEGELVRCVLYDEEVRPEPAVAAPA